MKIHHVLFFCIFSALCDGNGAEIVVHAEGGGVTVTCFFSLSGRRKLLCKDECKDGGVLIETEGDAAQRGKYSIKYREGTFPVSSTVLHVSIAQLDESDAGRYRCGLERPFLPDSYQEFEIRVPHALKTFPETVKQTEEAKVAAANHSLKGYVLPLVVCVAVLFAAVVLLFYKWKMRRDSDGSTTRGQSDRDKNNRRSRNVKVNSPL